MNPIRIAHPCRDADDRLAEHTGMTAAGRIFTLASSVYRKLRSATAFQKHEPSLPTLNGLSPFCDSSVRSQHKAAVVKVQQLTAMPLRLPSTCKKKPAEAG
jgi:hypothetical protein